MGKPQKLTLNYFLGMFGSFPNFPVFRVLASIEFLGIFSILYRLFSDHFGTIFVYITILSGSNSKNPDNMLI